MPEVEAGKHYSKDEGEDPPFPFSTGGTHLECHAQFWAPQHKAGMESSFSQGWLKGWRIPHLGRC